MVREEGGGVWAGRAIMLYSVYWMEKGQGELYT